MSLVVLERTGENEDIIYVDEAEVESPQNVVHEALKRLGGVAQAEGHEKGNSNRPKGVVMAVFLMSSGCTGIWLYALTRSILEKKQQPERCRE
jgi:hypothetical protein